MNRKLDLAIIDVDRGSDYPPPFDAPCCDRERKRLGDAAGLSQFGVNLLRLPPGTWSSQRHWQIASDEFVYVVSEEVVLITGAGEETLRAGDAAGFKAGTPRRASPTEPQHVGSPDPRGRHAASRRRLLLL